MTAAKPGTPLTPTETRILQLAATGRKYGQIAREIGTSVDAVKTHAARARVRLGASTTPHAVAIAFGITHERGHTMAEPEPQAPTITTWISRTWNGVHVEINEDQAIARIDIGTLPSWDLVGLIERRIAPAVVRCTRIDVTGENTNAIAYLVEQLNKVLPTTEEWLHHSDDTRRGGA